MIDSRPPFGFSPQKTAGLEPASGGYERPRILRALRSLNRNDAEFVDVIHTNANVIGLGTTSPIGHADFYPNGGQWQTGCFRTTEYDSFSKNFIHLIVSNLTALCIFSKFIAAMDERLVSLWNPSTDLSASYRCGARRLDSSPWAFAATAKRIRIVASPWASTHPPTHPDPTTCTLTETHRIHWIESSLGHSFFSQTFSSFRVSWLVHFSEINCDLFSIKLPSSIIGVSVFCLSRVAKFMVQNTG